MVLFEFRRIRKRNHVCFAGPWATGTAGNFHRWSKTPPHVKPRTQHRRVALIVESAVAPRRRMLAGVARYLHEHEPWAVYLKPFGVEKSLGHWLREWNGDGIIAAVAEMDV